MTTADLNRYEIDVDDVEYLRHGSKPFLARLYKPRGKGPFPLIINLHGGAWCHKDRTTDVGCNDPIARSGVVVASLDFRMPPDDPAYPAANADINPIFSDIKVRQPAKDDLVANARLAEAAVRKHLRNALARWELSLSDKDRIGRDLADLFDTHSCSFEHRAGV